MDEMNKRMLESLREATQRACEHTLSLGHPITFARDNKVIRQYPDGSEEIVKDVMFPEIKVTQKTYKLRE